MLSITQASVDCVANNFQVKTALLIGRKLQDRVSYVTSHLSLPHMVNTPPTLKPLPPEHAVRAVSTCLKTKCL